MKREFDVKEVNFKQAVIMKMKPSNDLKEQQEIFTEVFERS